MPPREIFTHQKFRVTIVVIEVLTSLAEPRHHLSCFCIFMIFMSFVISGLNDYVLKHYVFVYNVCI